MNQAINDPNEPNPVDDVRRVRERIDREVQGDIHNLAKQSQQAVERYLAELNLKIVPPPKNEIPPEEKTA